MIQVLKTTLSPIFSIAILMLGNAFFTTYISIRLDLDGYNESIIGYVQSAYFFGMLLGATRAEKLIRRIGHIRAFVLFGSITTATTLVMGFYIYPLNWLIMRFISGLCLAGLFIVIESWILDKSTLDTRGRILSIYMISIYTTQALGQFILDLIDPHTAEPFFATALLTSLSCVPISFTRQKSPDLHEPTLVSFRSLLFETPLGFSACVAGGILLSTIYTFTPVFANGKQLSVTLMMSITIAGGILLQWPIGKLSDMIDRRKIIVAISLSIFFPSLMISLFSSYPEAVYLFSFLLGGLCFTVYPVGITQTCERVESHNLTAVTGVLLIAYGIGATIGPLISPFFMKFFGIYGLYIYLSTFGLLLSLIGLFSILRRPPIKVDERSEFVPLPATSAQLLDLDPRVEPEEFQGAHSSDEST